MVENERDCIIRLYYMYGAVKRLGNGIEMYKLGARGLGCGLHIRILLW